MFTYSAKCTPKEFYIYTFKVTRKPRHDNKKDDKEITGFDYTHKQVFELSGIFYYYDLKTLKFNATFS
ncbi:MAG: hypothetical protein LBQ27_05765 [Clostridiales bacterium]|jgi:hypothetical protein|nr:hypothetical protein [Clostridiales bacterium]